MTGVQTCALPICAGFTDEDVLLPEDEDVPLLDDEEDVVFVEEVFLPTDPPFLPADVLCSTAIKARQSTV